MENKNINVSTNSTNETNATSVINGGGKMNNKFKQAREAEQVAKQEAKKAADRQARLDAIEPKDIVQTMDSVSSGWIRPYYNENGTCIGVDGGALYQKPITVDGKQIFIAAESPQALAEKEEQIKNGMQGDGYYHQKLNIVINGKTFPYCSCAGKTIEELEQDIINAENYAKEHINGCVIYDADVANQLIDAGYDKTELEQITGKDGCIYVLSYTEKRMMVGSGADLGETVANLDDIDSELSRKDIKTILLGRLNNYIDEHICDDCEEDCDDDECDDYEYPCEDEDEDDPCDYCRYYDDCQNPNKTRY